MEMRDVVGYNEYYAVSEDGQVWSKRHNKFMKPCKTKKGYLKVSLLHDGSLRGFFVHRLVCTAFHGEMPEEGMAVDHIDGDRANNRASNLRWVTVEENNAHRVDLGNANPQRKVVVFNEEGDVLCFPSKKAARKAGFPVDDILDHEAYTIRGYTAVYEDEWCGATSVHFEQMEEVRRRRFMAGRRKRPVSEPIVGVSLMDGSKVEYPSIAAARRDGYNGIENALKKPVPLYKEMIWYKPLDGVAFECSWAKVAQS